MQCFYLIICFKVVVQFHAYACSRSWEHPAVILTTAPDQCWLSHPAPGQAAPARERGFGLAGGQFSWQENQGVWMYISRAAWQDQGGAGSQSLLWREEQ